MATPLPSFWLAGCDFRVMNITVGMRQIAKDELDVTPGYADELLKR